MRKLLCMMGVCLLFACSNDSSGPVDDGGGGGGGNTTYQIQNAFPKLTFSRPTDVQNAGDGTHRLFVTQQTGEIFVFDDRAPDSVLTFLDISSEVQFTTNGEMGLLGLAFHPDYETNGFFFVAYTTGTPSTRAGRIARFHVSADPNAADPASEKILLEFADDYSNHNGGALCFGPDGKLYVSVGDEGGGGDPDDNAQDRSRIFGKILRLDVDQNINTIPYHGIPADNPYAGNSSGYREDIWAYGLRNAWRISFDGNTLVAGDVGQRKWEEIDIIQKGGNYGWDCREGLVAYDHNEDPSSALCGTQGAYIDPIHVYDHNAGQSITGGYVYRGPTLTTVTGRYVYADFDTGTLWALNLGTHANELLLDTSRFISTFGVGDDKELYFASYLGDGTPSALYRIVQTTTP